MNITSNVSTSFVLTDQELVVRDQSTVNRITEFRKLHPDITDEFIAKELNSTIVEMLFRIEREYRGE